MALLVVTNLGRQTPLILAFSLLILVKVMAMVVATSALIRVGVLIQVVSLIQGMVAAVLPRGMVVVAVLVSSFANSTLHFVVDAPPCKTSAIHDCHGQTPLAAG